MEDEDYSIPIIFAFILVCGLWFKVLNNLLLSLGITLITLGLGWLTQKAIIWKKE